MYHDVMVWNNNLEKKKDRTMLINAGYIFVTAISNFKGNYKEFTTIKIKVGVSIYRDQVRILLRAVRCTVCYKPRSGVRIKFSPRRRNVDIGRAAVVCDNDDLYSDDYCFRSPRCHTTPLDARWRAPTAPWEGRDREGPTLTERQRRNCSFWPTFQGP